MGRSPNVEQVARRPWRISSASSAIAAFAALLLAYCGENRVADGGSSSGVDNPSLTVGFVDAFGTPLPISGDLDVYTADQNPAVDPKPLLTIKIKNSDFTKLTGSDFTRLQILSSSASPSSLSKLSASSSAGAEGAAGATGARGAAKKAGADSAVTLFNLVLKTLDRTGSLVLGFKYDTAAKVFSRVDSGKSLSRFHLQPRPLIRYAAQVAREPVHGKTGRIFVPGTPFLATLVDSVFVFEDLPEGKFPLHLLSGNGNVYPMPIALDSKDSTLIYRPGITPLGPVDTTHQDSIPKFEVFAGESHEAFLEVASFLEGKVGGAGGSDPRLSVLWRLIKEAADSGRADPIPRDTIPHDTIPGKPNPGPRRADILSPTQLRSEVRFTEEGVYAFELAATIGVRAKTDTVMVSVRRLPPPTMPRIIKPGPGDTLVGGHSYSIQWEMPGKGPVTIQVSLDGGIKWVDLAQGYMDKEGLPIYTWTPPKEFGTSASCLVQIINEADSSLHARMEKPFSLLQ
ncbi:MAG: hypothetical protein ABIW76_22620 [Fibrobacteria bacterium]